GGAKLYGDDGFWADVSWDGLYRLRLAARMAILLLACSFGVFLLPFAVAFFGVLLLLPLFLISMISPGWAGRAGEPLLVVLSALGSPYLVALALPIYALCAAAVVTVARLWLTHRRRLAETFEWLLDPAPGRRRLLDALWEIARGPAISTRPPSEAELGRRYVSLLGENLGQPGFREL